MYFHLNLPYSLQTMFFCVQKGYDRRVFLEKNEIAFFKLCVAMVTQRMFLVGKMTSRS